MINWFKKNITLIIVGLILTTILTAAFFSGGNPGTPVAEKNSVVSVPDVKNNEKSEEVTSEKSESAVKEASDNSEKPQKKEEKSASHSDESSIASSESSEGENSRKTGADVSQSSARGSHKTKKESSAAPESSNERDTKKKKSSESEVLSSEASEPSETGKASSENESAEDASSEISEKEESSADLSPDNELSCTILISCRTAIDSPALKKSVRSVLPDDGIILARTNSSFSDGESVFDLLKKVCRANNIHLDFSSTPVSGGAYIKGIGNLYEFDCGSISGWMYKVNGEFPSVGCSEYALTEGCNVEFLYSCDLGADIGNEYKGE